MQSGGGGGGAHDGRKVGPTSSSASPSSSSSAARFDSMPHQQHQQQRQSFQQHLHRKPEGNEAMLAFQGGGFHGLMGGPANFGLSSGMMQQPQHPQQPRKFNDPSQQQSFSHFQGNTQNMNLGMEQQALTPIQQAYLHFAYQQKSNPGALSQQQAKMNMAGLMSNQALASSSSSRKPLEHFAQSEKQPEQAVSESKSEPNPSMQPTSMSQLLQTNASKPMQSQQVQQNTQLSMAAPMQAMQALVQDRNIDLSLPENANLMAQLFPLMQSRALAQHKANESNAGAQSAHVSMPTQVVSSQLAREGSPHPNYSGNVSGPAKARQTMMSGNGIPLGQPQQPSVNLNQGLDNTSNNNIKNTISGPDVLQMQNAWQSNRSSPQSVASPVEGGLVSSQGAVTQAMQQNRTGFTKQQLHVLKAQILAFRRLKKGERTLPQELLQAISPPPLDRQSSQPAGTSNPDRSAGKNVDVGTRQLEPQEKDPQTIASCGIKFSNEEAFAGDEKTSRMSGSLQGMSRMMKEPVPVYSSGKEEQRVAASPTESGKEIEHSNQKIPTVSDPLVERGKAVSQPGVIADNGQSRKPVQASNPPQPKDAGSTRKYHGPLFDFPYFTRKHDSFGSSSMVNNNNLTLAYDIKDLLLGGGTDAQTKKRDKNLRKISGLLAVNLERKRIRPDLVLRLQIEEKKLRLMDLQARLREEVDQQQQEIMAMPDRPYRKFVRLCERQRMDLSRQVQATQRAVREKQLKSIFQWRKKLLEAHWTIRDARTARNRGVAKYHEKMLREFSKRKDDGGRNKRMEALKNNDVERYREMLLEQQTSMPGEAAERYEVLSSFLTQTEDYLHKLGGKITAAKNQQEVDEAANFAAANARSQGLSEEEVRSAAACAREEVNIRNRFSEMNAPKDSSSVNKYYNLAHAVNERVVRQPSMLRAGTLRDYQLVGLQWMLSLYNNKLNGILADEMGLGKTVQVMALIAYLMEFKGNYGPHLIIVPNAVLVNWKSEFLNWLPSVSCIFYVGTKDQRSKLFTQEVAAMKFNVLVTTYEFIMYDRTKLSKLDWKYIIIDEAQRMKDRESVLARDLDRYRCQRRLLLTGTPLQNDLKELWSLLNLLLPEVFDNRKAFHDWFSQPFQKEGPTHNAEDDWLETEKKVIVIHRLHQILEPFMLRRRVEDVEGSLPPKVSIVLRCRMSAIQSAIYDWIKSTGTLRVDPEDEMRRVQKNPVYQPKIYKPLNNRCMELRKTCNHPLLNYPYFSDLSKDFLVRSCGKLWVLDRILVKLQRTGHRVLLFSTMTKLLDILEEYLQWRHLVFRRIDGTTSLEERESAILDFNSPDTDCFIFLLSIRAAGRGLNLQTADTVVIYDPDPNPKNEEQAVARAHRIGQKREVKVIYLEAVVDKIASHQKEDEFISDGLVDSEDDLAGKDRYMGTIEGLIRNNIQQYKIDMADEVINAGRFDQRTTHEERRLTLETLLHDDERYQETVHDVPSLQEVNRMIARSEEEVELFDQMDEDLDWEEEMVRYDQVPKWLRANTREVNSTITKLSKKPSKIGTVSSEVDLPEKRRGRPKGKNAYRELDEDDGFSEASTEERIGYSAQEEEGEIDDDENSPPLVKKDQPEEDAPTSIGGYDYLQGSQAAKQNRTVEKGGGSSGSSSEGRRLKQMNESSTSSQKFGSLSALDARPSSLSKKLADDLEEGEIVGSGDSHVDLQPSGSWIQERDEGEDEQAKRPKIKRKRSIRLRPRHTIEKPEEKYNVEKTSIHRRDASPLPSQVGHQYDLPSRFDSEPKVPGELKYDQQSKRNPSSRKTVNASKAQASPKENLEWKNCSGTSMGGNKMSDVIQRRCKNVVGKLQRRIDKEGPHIVPLLTDLWKRIESSGNLGGTVNSVINLRKIDQHIERFEYNGVMDLVTDVQLMLKSSMQYFGFSHEVRSEARKVHDLFFDILKIAFPDTDFQEARTALSFSAQVSTSTSAPSSKQTITPGQSKRHKQLINEAELKATPPQKLSSRASLSNTDEPRASRTHMLQKESRVGTPTSLRDQSPQDDDRSLTHPGDLVICKKKRKDREKAISRPGNILAGPVSPPSMSRSTRSSGPPAKEVRSSQGWANTPPQQQGSGGSGTFGWANPVKKLRTDSGKRRPSHL